MHAEQLLNTEQPVVLRSARLAGQLQLTGGEFVSARVKPDNDRVVSPLLYNQHVELTYRQHEETDQDAGVGDQGQQAPAHSVHQVEADEGGEEVNGIDPSRDPKYGGDVVADARHL